MASATTSDYLYKAEIEYLFRGGAGYLPGGVTGQFYVALFTQTWSVPTNLQQLNSGRVEVGTGKGYARVPVLTNGGWSIVGTSHPFAISNAGEIPFGTPGADWGTITSVGLMDSGVIGEGELYFLAKLTQNKTVNNGDGAPKILTGQLTISRAVCP